MLKSRLKVLAVLALAAFAAPAREASANNCPGDPWFFCDCARATMQQCNWEYQLCEESSGENCWETYYQCRLASGIDQCE